MASDAISMIKNDHRVLEKLFDRVQSGDGDRRALVEEIATRLTAHSHAEEQQVYPAIKKAAPDEADEVDHGYEEHAEADELLKKAVRAVDSPDFGETFTQFVEAVKHHVEEEESQVLPALRQATDAKTLEQLGAAFEQARCQELE